MRNLATAKRTRDALQQALAMRESNLAELARHLVADRVVLRASLDAQARPAAPVG